MAIGAIPYPERVRTLKKLLDPRREAFAKRRWSRAKQELVYGP